MGIIPARQGSKGIPNKNIVNIAGKPLIAHSIEIANNCQEISTVLVSTDSEKYAKIAEEYGAIVPFLRPREISQSDSTDIEYLKHALIWLGEHEGQVPEYVVLLRPTTPIRKVEHLREAVHLMKYNKTASSVVSVNYIEGCPYKWMIMGDNGYLKSPFDDMSPDDVNLPRQRFPKMLYPNGYVDVLRSKVILEENCVYGFSALPYFTDEEIIDIDEMQDLEKVRRLLQKKGV